MNEEPGDLPVLNGKTVKSIKMTPRSLDPDELEMDLLVTFTDKTELFLTRVSNASWWDYKQIMNGYLTRHERGTYGQYQFSNKPTREA